MIKNQLFIAAALFVGVAIGYLMKDAHKSETRGEEKKGYVAATPIADKGAEASTQALKARISELERRLANQPKMLVTNITASSTAPHGERQGPPSMKDMRERMEKLAREDPQRFAQITNRMARFRQRRMARANAKIEFLSAIDTACMTDDQRKAHEQYQDLLVRREELEEKMHNSEMTDEDQADIMREMHETEQALRKSARAERETLFNQTAKALGLTDEMSSALCETLNEVVNATENGHGMPPPPNSADGGAMPPGPR